MGKRENITERTELLSSHDIASATKGTKGRKGRRRRDKKSTLAYFLGQKRLKV